MLKNTIQPFLPIKIQIRWSIQVYLTSYNNLLKSNLQINKKSNNQL